MEKKKIAIITGSFRKNGNTTTLATAFAAGAMAAGNEVKTFNATTAKIDGCHGDNSCHERGCCGLKDDFVQVCELLNWADVLVLASPVYFGGFTSHVKRIIDRFNSISAPKGRALVNVKETVLISAAASEDMSVFTGIEFSFDIMNAVLNFESAGKLLVPGLSAANDASSNVEILTKAAIMGYNI